MTTHPPQESKSRLLSGLAIWIGKTFANHFTIAEANELSIATQIIEHDLIGPEANERCVVSEIIEHDLIGKLPLEPPKADQYSSDICTRTDLNHVDTLPKSSSLAPSDASEEKGQKSIQRKSGKENSGILDLDDDIEIIEVQRPIFRVKNRPDRQEEEIEVINLEDVQKDDREFEGQSLLPIKRFDVRLKNASNISEILAKHKLKLASLQHHQHFRNGQQQLLDIGLQLSKSSSHDRKKTKSSSRRDVIVIDHISAGLEEQKRDKEAAEKRRQITEMWRQKLPKFDSRTNEKGNKKSVSFNQSVNVITIADEDVHSQKGTPERQRHQDKRQDSSTEDHTQAFRATPERSSNQDKRNESNTKNLAPPSKRFKIPETKRLNGITSNDTLTMESPFQRSPRPIPATVTSNSPSAGSPMFDISRYLGFNDLIQRKDVASPTPSSSPKGVPQSFSPCVNFNFESLGQTDKPGNETPPPPFGSDFEIEDLVTAQLIEEELAPEPAKSPNDQPVPSSSQLFPRQRVVSPIESINGAVVGEPDLSLNFPTYDISDDDAEEDENNNKKPGLPSYKDLPMVHYPTREFQEYVSQDQQENLDNENPDWEELRQLKSDEERLQYAMRKFGNQIPSDPAENYTFHGYRRALKAAEKNIQLSTKAPKDVGTKTIENGELVPVEEFKSKKRKRISPGGDGEPAPKRQKLIPVQAFEDKMIDSVLFKNKWDTSASKQRMKNFNLYLRHFKYGWEETKSFLAYYRGGSRDQVKLSEEQERQIVDMEGLYRRFVAYYGPNPAIHCKACTEFDGVRVVHPF